MLNADSDLNGAVVFVGSGQTERTESPITAAGNRSGFDIAVQAIHVAFALVGIGVVFALTEEACLQKTAEPRRPVVLLIFPIVAAASHLLISIWAHSELINESKTYIKEGKNGYGATEKKKATNTNGLTITLWYYGYNFTESGSWVIMCRSQF